MSYSFSFCMCTADITLLMTEGFFAFDGVREQRSMSFRDARHHAGHYISCYTRPKGTSIKRDVGAGIT